MTYAETRKILNELRTKNEMIFRMAISHLMDVGIRNLNEENIEYTCKEIMKQDDSHSMMTNEFQCEIVKTAGEIAKVDHIHLLTYVSREIYYQVDNKLSYMSLLCYVERLVSYIHDEACGTCETYDILVNDIDMDEDDLIALGYEEIANAYNDDDEEEE